MVNNKSNASKNRSKNKPKEFKKANKEIHRKTNKQKISKTIAKLKSADGLVVGSAICKEITRSLNNRQNPVTNVSKVVAKLRSKIS
jgi:tryptophan synthase alpha chain